MSSNLETPRKQLTGAAVATASASIEADTKKLTIDESSAVKVKPTHLMAEEKSINAKTIQVALTANKPKVSGV